MVGTSDIPDWCYVEACGSEGKTFFTEAPSMEHLSLFYSKSPVSHLSKVHLPKFQLGLIVSIVSKMTIYILVTGFRISDISLFYLFIE